ncbi:hypothetical protein [Halobacterium litoreum]|uniref:Integral membrane protein n=1 Tax=Halobacterium litoreum TaxID=2039234 RepID=A0ABD5NHR1_9EURY|nr:hypothetical protein [Halobacterium litoreum]UHH12724.1 hypothetical protein LT972_11205 [Halobacterium litoreum]
MNRTDAAGGLFALAGLLSLGRSALQAGPVEVWAVAVGVGSLVAGGLFALDGRSETFAGDGTALPRVAVATLALACFLGGAGYALVS